MPRGGKRPGAGRKPKSLVDKLASYKNAITECMFKGTARNVVSEADGDESKNVTGA
jgi:hypothetical protein